MLQLRKKNDKKATIRSFSSVSPLDLNMITWFQLWQTIRDVSNTWKRINWRSSQVIPLDVVGHYVPTTTL